MAAERGAWGLEESKCHSYLQKGQGGRSRELQAGQAHLYPWEGDEATNAGNHFHAHEGQGHDWEQSAWIHKGQAMLDQSDNL